MKFRFLAGGMLVLHGLLRILFTERYLGFVFENFYPIVPFDTLLTIGATIIPFFEFFIGLLIICIRQKQAPIWVGFGMSFVSMLFLVSAAAYTYLIYHVVVLVLLSILYLQHNKSRKKKIILKREKLD